jgi:hypothetical protein
LPPSEDEQIDWLDPVRPDELVGRILFQPDDFDGNFINPGALPKGQIAAGLSVQRVACSVRSEVIALAKYLGRNKSPDAIATLRGATAAAIRSESLSPVEGCRFRVLSDPAYHAGHAVAPPTRRVSDGEIRKLRKALIDVLTRHIDLSAIPE